MSRPVRATRLPRLPRARRHGDDFEAAPAARGADGRTHRRARAYGREAAAPPGSAARTSALARALPFTLPFTLLFALLFALTACAPGGGNGPAAAPGTSGRTAGDTGRAATGSAPEPSPPADRPAPSSTSPRAPVTGSPSPTATGPVRGPDLSRPASARPRTTAPRTTAAPSPSSSAEERAGAGTPGRARSDTVITIGDWSARVVRGGQDAVDACRDAVQWTGPALGTEDGYRLRTAVLVGHDYCGFDRFATLPVGSTVTVRSPRGTWTYRVYATWVTPGRGAPAAGLYWGDLTLQSCVGPDTGFSYLMRV
ncbi:hypothetical protein ACFU96_24155 [Streptomyces sp. NPDC057620]|uniref:hypothetical protein n=1 Tax=Streptomyces sp. NPDC057620 TaxID=3346185 RepID=UPI003681589C